MSDDSQIPEDREERGGQRAGFTVPRWARPAGDAEARRGWRSGLRRKLIWPVAALVVLFAVWSGYPFIPNPWVALFRQPSGDASVMSAPGRWAMQGGNPQGSNFIPAAAAPKGVVDLVIEVGANVRSGAAVAGGVVYIGGQSRVVAFDAVTGQQIWEHPVSGPAHGVPAITDKALYLGTLNKSVIALDRGSGRKLWEYKGESPFPGSVTVQNGIVYAGSRGGDVHALDAESGDRLWTVELDSAAVPPVALDDGKLLAASNAGVLFIRRSDTGDKRARARTGAALVTPPAVGDGLVYLLSEGGLMAFDATVRELPGRYPAELVWSQLWVWGFPLPAPPKHSGLQWRVIPPDDMGAFLHPPAVTREELYLGTDGGQMAALSPKDGGLLWRMPVGPPVATSPLVAGHSLIVAHEDGSIRAVNRFNQQELWAVELGSPVAAPLSYAEGRVYAHTQDGNLYVIR